MGWGRKQYGNKRRTMQDKRQAAFMMLTMRETLDGVTEDSLVRSCGVTPVEAKEMLEKERARRAG